MAHEPRHADLPDTIWPYVRHERTRPSWDPIGLRSLPATRTGLDGLVDELKSLLQGHGVPEITPRCMTGDQVARALFLHRGGPRAVRALVTYAQVHWREWRIVGVPGHGYFWGPAHPDLYAGAVSEARRRGRAAFARAALMSEGSAQQSIAQLAFNFMMPPGPDETPAGEHEDLLNAMVDRDAGGGHLRKVLGEFLAQVGQTRIGREALQNALDDAGLLAVVACG